MWTSFSEHESHTDQRTSDAIYKLRKTYGFLHLAPWTYEDRDTHQDSLLSRSIFSLLTLCFTSTGY